MDGATIICMMDMGREVESGFLVDDDDDDGWMDLYCL